MFVTCLLAIPCNTEGLDTSGSLFKLSLLRSSCEKVIYTCPIFQYGPQTVDTCSQLSMPIKSTEPLAELKLPQKQTNKKQKKTSKINCEPLVVEQISLSMQKKCLRDFHNVLIFLGKKQI